MNDRYTACVITVSDKASRGERVDTAGPAVMQMLREVRLLVKRGNSILGIHPETEPLFEAVDNLIVPDEMILIQEALRAVCMQGIALVLTAGGTGFSPRDVTPEATRGIIKREAPGIAELMRFESMKITPNAALSRAVAGIRGRTLIVNLPGSKKAACENLDAILPILPHALAILRSEETECGSPRST